MDKKLSGLEAGGLVTLCPVLLGDLASYGPLLISDSSSVN